MAIIRVLTCVSALLTGLCTVALGQTVVRPDSSSSVRTFHDDSITQSIVLERQWLVVRSEVDSAGRRTGRYTVHRIWPGSDTTIASYTDDGAPDAPSIALVADGVPAIVVLSSYTGGFGRDGIPNYTFKVLILTDTLARAYTVGDYGPESPFGSGDVTSFSRSRANMFEFHLAGGPRIRYEHGALSWSVAPAK